MKVEARRLRPRHVQALRQAIKDSTLHLPKRDLRAVLQLMDELRARRLAVLGGPAPNPLPAEMARGEIYRELKWRLGTLPPDETEAVAGLVVRIARRSARPPAAAAPGRGGSPVATALVAILERLLRRTERT